MPFPRHAQAGLQHGKRQISGRVLFPLLWRWRHAAEPGWNAHARTEGRARRRPHYAFSQRQSTAPGGPAPSRTRTGASSSPSFSVRPPHTHRRDIMREIVHLQAGQCGNQIGAKVRKRAQSSLLYLPVNWARFLKWFKSGFDSDYVMSWLLRGHVFHRKTK